MASDSESLSLDSMDDKKPSCKTSQQDVLQQKIKNAINRIGFGDSFKKEIEALITLELSNVALFDKYSCSTNSEYELLLEKNYEEIDDLTCMICLEKMKLDESVIRTLCSTTGIKQATKVHSSSQKVAQSEDTFLICDPLKGHKFHKDCFLKWLNMQRDRLLHTQTLFHSCPICREDVMSLQAQSLL